MRMKAIWRLARQQAGDEDGSITVLSLFMFVVMLMGAGLAIDVNNAMQARQQLQNAADAAGHAALLWQYKYGDRAASRTKAETIAELNMPLTYFGDVLATADIEFGDWDRTTRTFTKDPVMDSAVRVTTRRINGNSNAVTTMLMKFIGVDHLNLTTVSVWDMEDGYCPPRDPDKKRGEGFFAIDVVDIQSNNNYYDGFCIHSESHVELQNGNTYEDGVVVSSPNQWDTIVPDWADVDTKNAGLMDALSSQHENLQAFFNDLPDLIADYSDPTFSDLPSYITDKSQVYNWSPGQGQATITQADLVAGAINFVNCGKNGTVTVNGDMSGLILVSDCIISFGSKATIKDMMVISTNTAANSVNVPADFTIGDTKYCNTGKGATEILTMGGFKSSAGINVFGANVIADGDISITANSNGLADINFMSGGRIDATSNSDMGFCKLGPPQPFIPPVIRMVM